MPQKQWSSASSPPEIVDCVEAGASVQTGGAVAFVDVDVAVVAREAGGTVASVAARQVLARTPVQAGVGEALVDFQLAAEPCRWRRDIRNRSKVPSGMKSLPSSHL